MENQLRCPECNTQVLDIANQNTIRPALCLIPVNKKLNHIKSEFIIPFYCKICGAIKFNYHPILNRVFLYWKPLPEKVGSIHLPEAEDYRGGGPRLAFAENIACVLAKGPGAWGLSDPDNPSSKKKWFSTHDIEIGDLVISNRRIRPIMEFEGTDAKKYKVSLVNSVDIPARWETEELLKEVKV